MDRIATCPKCMTEYELEEDDIGHLVECECGVTLFACHTRSLDTFAVPCGNCGGVHDVRGRDVGRTVSVECGGKLRVPQALLRLPVGDRKLALHAKARLSRTGSGHGSLKPADRNGGADLAETRTASVSGNVKDHQPLDAQPGVPGRKGTSNPRAVAASPVRAKRFSVAMHERACSPLAYWPVLASLLAASSRQGKEVITWSLWRLGHSAHPGSCSSSSAASQSCLAASTYSFRT